MHSSINASTPRTNAFPNSNSPTLAVQRLHVTVIAGGVVAPRPRRRPAVLRAVFLFPGGNAAMPPNTSSIVFRLVSRGGDGDPHTTSITGILRQPAFQALPGRITEMFDHFGGRH